MTNTSDRRKWYSIFICGGAKRQQQTEPVPTPNNVESTNGLSETETSTEQGAALVTANNAIEEQRAALATANNAIAEQRAALATANYATEELKSRNDLNTSESVEFIDILIHFQKSLRQEAERQRQESLRQEAERQLQNILRQEEVERQLRMQEEGAAFDAIEKHTDDYYNKYR